MLMYRLVSSSMTVILDSSTGNVSLKQKANVRLIGKQYEPHFVLIASIYGPFVIYR